MAWQNKDNERLIEIIREMFAEERQLISGNTVSLATQSSRLEQLNMQISTVVNQQESMRADFNTRWGDLPKIYIPRQEVLAMGHEGRLSNLEDTQRKMQADTLEMKLVMQQQIQQSILTNTRDIAKVQLDEQADTAKQRQEIDGRAILMYSTAAFTLISIVLTIWLHFA